MPDCFVPRCTSGRVGSKGRHFFKVPASKLKHWARLIPRKDRQLTVTSRVCDVHFEERFLVKSFVNIINGETVEIPREKWTLTKDAFPSKFPNCPSYLSIKVPKKRTSPSERRRRAGLLCNVQLSNKKPGESPSNNNRFSTSTSCSKDQKQCAPDMNIIPQEIKLEIIPKIEQGESSSQLASTSSLQTLPDFNDTIRTAVLNIKKEPIDYTEYNQAESSTQLGFSSSSFQTLPAAGPAFLNIKKEPIDYTEYNQEEFSSEPLPSGESSIFKGSEMLPIKIKTEPLDYPDDCNPECILPDFL